LFLTQLSFVVAHEYTHHVHGHVSRPYSVTEFRNEIPDSLAVGCLEDQAQEVDADGYAVYFVLAHLIKGVRREGALTLLGQQAASGKHGDEILFSLFIVAVGGFFHVRSPAALEGVSIYKLSHPPQAARMNYVMHSALGWCKQNRPALEAWLTLKRYQVIMSAVVEAIGGINGEMNWSAQTSFLLGNEGTEYIRQLSERFASSIKNLPERGLGTT
jgi:hypothetical protein